MVDSSVYRAAVFNLWGYIYIYIYMLSLLLYLHTVFTVVISAVVPACAFFNYYVSLL